MIRVTRRRLLKAASLLLFPCLIQTLPVLSANASPNCTTNPDKGILCQGDAAWRDGFLVSPEFVKAAKSDHDLAKTTPGQCILDHALASKVPELQEQRNQAMTQRDEALAHGSALQQIVTGRDQQIAQLNVDLAKMTAQRDSRWGLGQVTLVGIAGIAVGGVAMGLYAILK